MKWLCALFALFITWVAQAEVPATLTWTHPTQYTNGDPLPLSHISGYYVVADSGASVTVDGTETTATLMVEPGDRCFIAQTQATNGLSSTFVFLCKDIPGDGPPGEPVMVCP